MASAIARGGEEPALAQRLAAEQERGRFTAAQRLDRELDLVLVRAEHHVRDGFGTGLGAVEPRRVGREDQRRDAAASGLVDRVGDIGADRLRPLRLAHPARHVVGHADDVGRERRVERLMVGGLVADDVDDRGAGPARVVQIRQAVAETRTEVQERGRGLAGHAPVPVGRAGRDTFEQHEDRPHLRNVVEGGDEVHLRRTGIREAHVDAVRDERPQDRVRTVHDLGLLMSVEERSGVEDAGRIRITSSGPHIPNS